MQSNEYDEPAKELTEFDKLKRIAFDVEAKMCKERGVEEGTILRTIFESIVQTYEDQEDAINQK